MNVAKCICKWTTLFTLLQVTLFIPQIVTGQSYQHLDYLTTEEGLPANYIVASEIDIEGYLWILTKVGMCRYDGRKCMPVDLPISSIDLSFITYMIEYPAGTLILVRSNGEIMDAQNTVKHIYCYDIKSGEVTSFERIFSDLPFAIKDITNLKKAGTNEGILFIINGQEVYHLKEDQFYKVFQAQNEILYYTNWVEEDTYQITSNRRLIEISAETTRIRENIGFKTNGTVSEASYAAVTYGTRPQAESTHITPYFLDSLTFKFTKWPIYIANSPLIFRTAQDDWVSTEKDWIHINNQLDTFYSIPIGQFSDDNFFTTHQILQPNSSTIVFAGNNGVHALSYKQLPFRKIQHPEKTISFRGMITLNNDTLMANSYDGQFFIDRHARTITSGSNKMMAIYQGYGMTLTDEAVVWNGAHSNEVIRQISPFEFRKSYRVKNEEGEKVKAFLPFYDYTNATLWLGTMKGLQYYSPPLDSFMQFDKGRFADSLANAAVSNLRVQNDSLWICTNKGLFLNTVDEGITEHLLQGEEIIDVYIDIKDQYWIATRQQGVLLWNKNQNTRRYFNTGNGLSNNSTTCIYPDYLGNLWIPTFHGLNYLNTTDLSIQTFFEDDGIANSEFNFGAHLSTADSFLYLGGINGITEIDLRYSEDDSPFGKSDLPLVINGYSVYDKDNEVRVSDDLSKGIELYYADNYFDLDFSIVDFSGEPEFDFAYRIDGIHEDWMYKTSDKLQLSKPYFGNYLLHIKARGIDGRWSSQQLAIPITSYRPFFLTWWFLGAISLLATATVYGIFRFRLQYLKRRSMELEQEVQLRTETINEQLAELEQNQGYKDQVFSIIGHDLRSPVLGMRNFSEKVIYLIQEQRFDQLLNTALQFDSNLNYMHKLLENLLDWSRLERGDYLLKPVRLNLSKALRESLQLYELNATKKEISFDLNIADQALINADQRAISTILRNLLDNAIKNSPQKSIIKVELSQRAQQVQLDIHNQEAHPNPTKVDNENLLSHFLAQKGLGIKICDELIRMSGGEWSVRYGENGLIVSCIVFKGSKPPHILAHQ